MNLIDIVKNISPILGTALGGPAGGLVGTAIASLFGANPKDSEDLIKRINSDANAILKLKELELDWQKAQLSAQAQSQQGQIEIGKIQAANSSKFISGGRPFIEWICGISLGLYFIPQYIMGAYIWFDVCIKKQQLMDFPLDTNGLIHLVMALLGLGTLKTVEKFNGRK